MEFFNFSEDLIKWVDILLSDFKAVINHCGNVSRSFEIGRGCRQGDPIASYLFILCIEILAHKLRTDKEIRGFEFNANNDNTYQILQHLLEIYADDMTIFADPSNDNLRNIINTLSNFYKISGLKISYSKTKALWFGSKNGSEEILCPDLGLKWDNKFKLLGIEFDSNLDNTLTNFNDKIMKLSKVLGNWSYRYLTPFGKATVVKTLGLSKLSHLALVLPNPTKDMIKQIETMIFKFIWSGKSEKVRREDAKLPVKLGGLSVPDVSKYWTAFKFSWF